MNETNECSMCATDRPAGTVDITQTHRMSPDGENRFWEEVTQLTGTKYHHTTGFQRDNDDGKPRPDLISPWFLTDLGHHLGNAAKKYGEFNYALGQPLSRALASGLRHFIEVMKGSTAPHAIMGVASYCMFVSHTRHMIAMGNLPAELDDMPKWDDPAWYDKLRKESEARS